jgi:hypothetical protein
MNSLHRERPFETWTVQKHEQVARHKSPPVKPFTTMWCSGSEKLQEMVWYTLSNSKRFLSNQAEELSKKNIRRPTSWIGTSSRANFNSNTVAGNLNKLQNWRSTFTSAPHEQNHTWQQITGDWQRFCNLTQPVQLAGAGLFWEYCWLVAGLLWEKSTADWWLISQANRALVVTSEQDVTKGMVWSQVQNSE